MLSAGLEGNENNLKLPSPDKRNLYTDHDGVKELPANLGEALKKMTGSKMLRKRMGPFIVDAICHLGENNWKEACREISGEELKKYF